MDEVWPVATVCIAGVTLVIVNAVSSPFWFTVYAYLIFLFLSTSIVMLLTFLSLFIGMKIGEALESFVDNVFGDAGESVVKILFVAGAVYGLWSMGVDLWHHEWSTWGFHNFSRLGVLRGLVINIGGVMTFCVINLLAPWTWISVSIGVITE